MISRPSNRAQNVNFLPILVYLKCSMKVRKLLLYEFSDKKCKILLCLCVFLRHLSIGEESTLYLYIRFLSTFFCFFSLTENFFYDRSVFNRPGVAGAVLHTALLLIN